MKKLLFWFLILCFPCFLSAQDTFSIVAVDSVTGEIGSAGASCVGSSSSYPHGAAILSDVLPGIGAIHTQASWNSTNQQNAHDLMVAGDTPQQIIDWLVANDASNNPTIRQYGIVSYNDGHPLGASYTGVNCLDYKNDTNGFYYCIQGNILLGQQILDSMQTRFLNTTGTLADRLMAALQGAKVLGADTRCASRGTSSQSSFLRIGRPTDPYDTLYCDLWMAYPTNFIGQFPVDPIDSLQTLYDLWKTSVFVPGTGRTGKDAVRVFYSHGDAVVFEFPETTRVPGTTLMLLDLSGRVVSRHSISGARISIPRTGTISHGLYVYRVCSPTGEILASGKIVL